MELDEDSEYVSSTLSLTVNKTIVHTSAQSKQLLTNYVNAHYHRWQTWKCSDLGCNI